MSQRSLPKSRLDNLAGCMLIPANQKLACTNRSGINYIFFDCKAILWPGRFEVYSAFKVGNIQDFDNEKCSRSWRMRGIVSFSTAWVRKLHWFSSWRQGQNTAFKSIAIAVSPQTSLIYLEQVKFLNINWNYCWLYCRGQNEGADEVDRELKRPKFLLMIHWPVELLIC